MEFKFQAIGIIHTPFTEKADTPIQASRSKTRGWVEVTPEFAAGLQDIEGLSHLYLIYAFHKSEGYDLQVKPFLDDQLHGLFSTRHPRRPNPIGISVVKLLSRDGNKLHVEGVDILDGTPLLDIKPYMEEFDIRLNTRAGWYETRSKK